MTASEATSRLAESFRSASRLAAATVMATGVLVLAGWLIRVPALIQVVPDAVAMAPNTAVGFLLAGLSLWLQAGRKADSNLRPSRVAAAAVGLLGLLDLVQYASGRNLGSSARTRLSSK